MGDSQHLESTAFSTVVRFCLLAFNPITRFCLLALCGRDSQQCAWLTDISLLIEKPTRGSFYLAVALTLRFLFGIFVCKWLPLRCLGLGLGLGLGFRRHGREEGLRRDFGAFRI
jgi:hypothetical protein